jgi:hypothetical protein
MSTQELVEKEVADLPESMQREVYDFARFLRFKREEESFNGLLLSETALAKDWSTPMDGLVADTWGKLGPAPELDYDQL